jgi:hypothetical protein
MNTSLKIVPFREKGKKEESKETHQQMWVCHCGCFSFRLFDNGYTQCSQCGKWQDHVRIIFDS